MNKIIDSFLDAHIKEYQCEDMKRSRAFEHFINRCIGNRYIVDRIDPEDMMPGDGERGIDGIAIVVNDRLISSFDDLKDECSRNELVVRFVFIQTKMTDSFESAEIAMFIRAVRSFFLPPERRQQTNRRIEELIAIKDQLYQNALKFKGTPSLDLYYACCGIWQEGNGLWADINVDIDPLRGDFSEITFNPFDSDKIINCYKELKKKIERTIVMDKKIALPKIAGISQAYLGAVKCKEFIQLLQGTDGNMLPNIFEDNVRDFQGYNTVNREIQKTIEDATDQERFAVLNNGITIIAKKLTIVGDTIGIFDYQIVNGCQTSYVLFENRNKIHDSAYIVVKVIEVSDEEILDRITFTTNRQTEVKAEAFTSTNHFHKRLQDFYDANGGLAVRLFYERRSKQYDLVDDVNKNCIVTLANQIQNYVAMFLNEPHSIHRYYGELLKSYGDRMFLDNDIYDLYYISSFCAFQLDRFFKQGRLSTELNRKIFKFHFLFAFRLLCVGGDVVFGKKRKEQRIANSLWPLIKNETDLLAKFQEAVVCVENTIEHMMEKGFSKIDLHRRRELTGEITKQIQLKRAYPRSNAFLQPGDIVDCTVLGVDNTYVNVSLATGDSRNTGSIHISKISSRHINNLRDEVRVGERFQARILPCSDYNRSWGWEMEKIVKPQRCAEA